MHELLEDASRSAYLAVAHPTEMAVTETLQLREGLRRDLGRDLDAVIVNTALPRRFEGGELQRIAASGGDGGAVKNSAVRAAASAHSRARAQRSSIARLRRERIDVVTVPFAFTTELDLAAVEGIADRLGDALSDPSRRGRANGT